MISAIPGATVSRTTQKPQRQLIRHAEALPLTPGDRFMCLQRKLSFGAASTTLLDQALCNRQSPQSTAEKLRATNEEALALFTRFKNNPAGLLQNLRERGVLVFDSKTHPWVDMAMFMSGAQAMFSYPNAYLGKPKDQISIDESDWEPVKSFKSAIQAAEDQTAFSLFVTANYEYLLHEAYHLLQAMHGLPWIPSAADDGRGNVTSQFMLDLQARFNKTSDRTQWAQLAKDAVAPFKTQSPDQLAANTAEANREFEVRDFLVRHQNQIGLQLKTSELLELKSERWMLKQLCEGLKP